MAPLHKAAMNNDVAAVRALLAAGAPVNQTAGAGNLTPLHYAASTGAFEAARVLLDAGADVFARSWRGTPREAALDVHQDKTANLIAAYERHQTAQMAAAPLSGREPAGAPDPAGIGVALRPGPAKREKLAVLDLRTFATEITKQNAQYFTDVIRQATLKWAPDVDVMTRENLLVLLQASGKRVEECEGECEVDTGRRIGADRIISGEIQKVGTRFKISLRLHETHEGRLLSSSIATGNTVDELDDSAAKGAEELFKPR